MIENPITELSAVPVKDAEQVTAQTLLGVCASLKPAPGRQQRSAVRSLLSYALANVNTVYPDVLMLDLRQHPIPQFDGRLPHEMTDPSLQFVLSCVNRSGGLLLSVPAYWSGVSGVFKNFIDILCGPAYAMTGEISTVFKNKPVGLIVVGADKVSAQAGLRQAQEIMTCVGAILVGEPAVVANPQSNNGNMEQVSFELVTLAAELACHVRVHLNNPQ